MSRHIVLIIEGTFPWYRGGVSEWVDRYIKYSDSFTFGIIQIVMPPFFGQPFEKGFYPIRDCITNFEQIKPPDMNLTVSSEGESYIEDWLSDKYREIEPVLKEADIIHAANTGFAGLLGAHIKDSGDLPLVVTEHAVYWKEVNSGAVALECGLPVNQPGTDSRTNISNTFQKIARTVYDKADHTVSVAHSNIPDQQRLGANYVTYIPNGVDKETLYDSSLPKAHKCNLTVGWAGRCAHIKQPLRFLDLAERINTIGSNRSLSGVRFEMYLSRAGEDELENEVSKRASHIPNIKLLWNKPAKIAMRRFDALCISSISEAQPLVVLEAIAAKALPFGWQCGDLNSGMGYFFSQKVSIDEIADSLIDLWIESDRWQTKIEQLFGRVKKEHVWQKIFKQYKDLFDSLIEESKSPVPNSAYRLDGR